MIFQDSSDHSRPETITQTFYAFLRTELVNGNPYLDKEEQARLRSHYPFMMEPNRYPPELVSTIYTSRRVHPVQAILDSRNPLVFDAGYGYGSDSFLFAALGAKVLAVDVSTEQIEIARKRKRYYEETLDRSLDVTFGVADLNGYTPEGADISLTWLASVLAVIENQDAFLNRIYQATRAGGKIMIVDFNLWNPPFILTEWRRRRQALRKSPEFARYADFWAMVRRRKRRGAFFFPQLGGGLFDDVQFFTPGTLGYLLERVGFQLLPPGFSGFAPPVLFKGLSAHLEKVFSRVPIVKNLGRAYLVTGVK
jgi:SAM-dependent methyltransferase